MLGMWQGAGGRLQTNKQTNSMVLLSILTVGRFTGDCVCSRSLVVCRDSEGRLCFR